MVTTENGSNEILTFRLAFDHHHPCAITPKGARVAVSSRQDISQEANPLPYDKAIQIGTTYARTNTKTLEQRIADIEFNFEEASRGDHRRLHFLGRKRLSLNRVQRQHLNNQSKQRPNRRKKP